MGKTAHDHLLGRTIAGKFVIESLIGSGAMGAVFRARQVALEKTVAIKVLHGELAGDATFATRFHREAKAASRLNHPNSMQVIDFGAEPDGLLYIAMEYLDGRSLHKVLRDEWPLTPDRVADVLMQTLAALAVAHDMGVVHRDLKPENVMVLRGTDDDGRPRDIVKVCDFGIAKITDSRAYRATGEAESGAPVTTAGFMIGTPEYMSPEQGRGEKLDPRSDLYSVGVILYEMLTKRLPFEAESAIGIVLKHVAEEPVRPSMVAPGVDPRLEAICYRALRKFREQRYANAREMRGALRPIAEARAPITAPGVGARVQVVTESPASVNAATVHMPFGSAPATPARALEEGPVKPTFVGTSAAVPAPMRRRGLLVVGFALTALAVGGLGTALVWKGRTRSSRATATVTVEPTANAPPPEVMETPEVPEVATVPELVGVDDHTAGSGVGGHGASKSKAGTGAAVVATTSATAIASASPSAGPGAATIVASAAPAATQAPPPPAPPPPAIPALPDPNFDPQRAYVEVGLINAEGVRERAVRGGLREIGLAVCYRNALRTRGVRATGVATLNLSIDETGATRSAIVTGADFLPGLARCLQGVSAGVRVGRGQVDSGGGVAEVTLAFKAP